MGFAVNAFLFLGQPSNIRYTGNMSKLKISVLGAGAFGTALAKVMSDAGHEVLLWARDAKVVNSINETHYHPNRLKGVELGSVIATTNEQEACQGAHLIISGLPMSALREVLTRLSPYITSGTYIVSTTKGIEPQTLYLPNQILCDVFPQSEWRYLSYLSGPSFALEIAKGLPCAVTVAAEDAHIAQQVQEIISTDKFRAYVTTDVVGVELGGALKNVIAIAAGAVQGMGFGNSALAGLITRGVAEMTRLAVKMGGHPQTLAGLSGLGDLVLTCTGDLSRNRAVGFGLAQGKSLQDILAELGQVAEGVQTAKSVVDLASRYDVEMPICECVYQALYAGLSVQEAMTALMTRPLRHERE